MICISVFLLVASDLGPKGKENQRRQWLSDSSLLMSKSSLDPTGKWEAICVLVWKLHSEFFGPKRPRSQLQNHCLPTFIHTRWDLHTHLNSVGPLLKMEMIGRECLPVRLPWRPENHFLSPLVQGCVYFLNVGPHEFSLPLSGDRLSSNQGTRIMPRSSCSWNGPGKLSLKSGGHDLLPCGISQRWRLLQDWKKEISSSVSSMCSHHTHPQSSQSPSYPLV